LEFGAVCCMSTVVSVLLAMINIKIGSVLYIENIIVYR
jgi:hypothetical protein